MLRSLLLVAASVAPALHAQNDVDELRKTLRHDEALAALRAAVEEGAAGAAPLLAEVTLEAELLARLDGDAPRPGPALVSRLAELELAAHEEVALARLAFLLDVAPAGEAALGRARDLDPALKASTDRVLASARGEALPAGGYFRYRGLWLPLAERDRERLFDLALEALWAVAPDRDAFRMEPTPDAPNRALFVERWKGAGAEFLARHAERVRATLDADYATVRGWLTSYDAPSVRDKLLASFEGMRAPREEALALIRRYDKPAQPEVDAYRAQLEVAWAAHEKLLTRDWRAVDQFDPGAAYALLERLRAREGALAHVDRYLAAYEGGGLPPTAIAPPPKADTSPGHVLPGREQSGLEDVLWLVLHHAADQHLDVMARGAELGRNTERLTTWENMVLAHVRLRSIDIYNARVATTMDATERECCRALDDYRKVLGLEPLEIEERLVTSARKHSQEMLDLDYFGHISPIERNRSPSDRARLEGFGGSVGENCLAGGASGRGAFEGWYHSPGHHRGMIASGPQIGVGAAGGHHMWTMVVGGTDLSWRLLHRDLPPARRAELVAAVDELIEKVANDRPADEQTAAVVTELPDVLPMVASQAFAAITAGRQPLAKAAPVLLRLIVDADVALIWRPLQVAAVAGAIDLLDAGPNESMRADCFSIVRPLLADDRGYDPAESRKRRLAAVLEIRRAWEDVDQLRYRSDGIAEIQLRPSVPGRRGDGASRRAALRALTSKQRKRLAERHGGGSETEEAVEAGLKWLASVQDADGGWRARSFALNFTSHEVPEDQIGRGNQEWEVAMTGFALLAFCSAGHTLDQGDHTETVDAGARFLMQRITDYGRFESTSGQYMYSHSIATQALCELYAYSDHPILGVYAQMALDFLIYAQDERGGGWRYEANQAGDTSVTGWAVMALNAGYKAGLDVAGFRDGLRFIDSVTEGGYYRVRYMPGSHGQTNRLGSIGALCRLFLAAEVRDPRVLWCGRRMLLEVPHNSRVDYYYWYYGSLVMFQLGGEFWDGWNAALKPALLSVQNREDGSVLEGAWPATGAYANNGGRVMQTSLAVLMLTTYYRYDRERDPVIKTQSGDVDAMAAPYLEVLLGDADEVTKSVTRSKLIDSFGVTLAPVLFRELRRAEHPAEARVQLASLLPRVVTPRHERAVLALVAEEQQGKVAHQLALALQVVCSARSADSLAQQLGSSGREVRLIAARTLGRLRVAESVAPLSARLAQEPDAAVKAEIEKALATLAEPLPVTTLVDAALEKDDPRRLAVLDGLEFLSSDDLARELVAEAELDAKLHARVLDAIREHGREAGVPVLLLALESRRVELRALAIKLLTAYAGVDHGFQAEAASAERKKALRKWSEWWQKMRAQEESR